MQKLRPYIIPGLFLFHLVMLCVMIFTVRGDAEWHDSPQYTASFLSQLLLTALWASRKVAKLNALRACSATRTERVFNPR